MNISYRPALKAIAVAVAFASLSFSAGSFADEVKSLRGKPSSSQILEALSPGRPSSGVRTRGLSLGNSDAVKAESETPAAQAQEVSTPASAQAQAQSGPRALDLDIKFEFNSGQLNQDGKDVLDQLGEALKSDALAGAKLIVLEGHADAKGNPAYNKVLSLRRAQSARSYLASKGIPSSKVKAVGKGSSEPVDKANPEDEVNRRVRVIIEG